MSKSKSKSEAAERLDRISSTIYQLSDAQVLWIDEMVEQFSKPYKFTLVSSDFFNQKLVDDFGDTLRVHHCFSKQAFGKDKFEYILERLCPMNGMAAELASTGNPGYDIKIIDEKISLKTEGAKTINKDKLHISKFMELGKDDWEDKIEHLEALRDRFLARVNSCDRVFVLRALYKNKNWPHKNTWLYELVEIPNQILLLASGGRLEFSASSKQKGAKPGNCYVEDGKRKLFNLYFDGGSERKLQVKNLDKNLCKVHATWLFTSENVLEEPDELAKASSRVRSMSSRKGPQLGLF
jgi:hypothetical protein